MYIFGGEFNEGIKDESDIWRVFDPYFQDPFTLFRNDLEHEKEEDFFSTRTVERSALQTRVDEMDIPQRRVSSVIHSNWQTRYLSTMKIPSFFNKFLFISLQGKSHDKEVPTNLQTKSTTQKNTA